MPYYIDASKIIIEELLFRITETDLVPSRIKLLEGVNGNFDKLKENGILTIADFRKVAKNPKNLRSLSEKTSIELDYLTLLRREVESYFPKAFPLNAFDWLDSSQLKKLIDIGYKNTALLYDAFEGSGNKEKFIASIGLEQEFADEILSLVNLTRVQWVNPIFAKVLFEAGYYNAKEIAEANAEDLHRAIDVANSKGQYYKGNIGLRDIKRLGKSAAYVE